MPLAIVAAHLEREGPEIANGGWAVDLLASPWGALVGSLAGYRLRTRLPRALGVPSLLVAFAEDGVAFWLGRWAVRR